MKLLHGYVSLAAICLAVPTALMAAAPAELDFNRDIRPILSENCFYCHGRDGNKRQAELRLDVRESAIEVGAIVPHHPRESQLVERIKSDDPELRMPPPDSHRILTAAQKKLLEEWIAAGAAYQLHWAFVPPRRPREPEVQQAAWPRTPIDRFILAKLEDAGLAPSPEADRATLIKRLSIDLLGLPPTPAEVEAFVADAAPRAYERLVDSLLDSEHYGERMALPWLDAARYADSNGFQQDGDTWQWMWRDWVVQALNADLPFDQFTIWQLAGDLLPEATTEQKIASSFNRNHLLNGEGGAIAEEQRFVNLFDRIDTTATTWLGLTMACAQCHDHKYDPLTQQDYYRLLDAFNRVPEIGRPKFFSARIRVAEPYIELPTEENQTKIAEFESRIAALEPQVKIAADAAFAGWRAGILADGRPSDAKDLPDALTALLGKAATELTGEEQTQLDTDLRKHFDQKVRPGLQDDLPGAKQLEQEKQQLAAYKADQIPRVMVMSDDKPRETHILDRGAYLSPLEPVSFATPAFLPPLPPEAPANRLGLAQWLVAPENPLTARVQVNRMWQHFFGIGLVKTAEDFGVQGEFPIHGELLDWLATEFRECGWSMKAMQRLMVTSATYRQASRMSAEHGAVDKENRLLARGSRFRMPAMILRDWALAAAGLLDRRVGGAPVYPYQPAGIWDGLAITKERDFTYPTSSGSDLYRRSLYTFWRRTVSPANMFDASSRQACRVRQNTNNTPLHALTTLNDPTWVEAARVLAEQCIANSSDLDQRLTHALERVLCRPARQHDLEFLRHAYQRQLAIYQRDLDSARALLSVGRAARDETLDVAEHAAMSAVCLAILNLDEALTRE